MREDIKRKLASLAGEEYADLAESERPDLQRLYGRPGRFIIERRRVSYISTGRIEEPITLHVHPTGVAFPEHTHDFIELMYVYSGSMTHTVGGVTVEVAEGDTILFGKGARHSVMRTGEDDLGVNVIISTEIYEKLLSDARRSSSLDVTAFAAMLDVGEDGYLKISSKESCAVRAVIELLIDCALTGDFDGYITEVTTALFLSHLIASVGGAKAKKKESLLLDYVRTSYASATLTEAAEILGFTPSYLSRWCREKLGTSFKEMLMEERFRAACDLLKDTDMPIGGILSTVGYENSSYFHKEFKKRLGTTPKEYRHQSRAGTHITE